MASLTEILKSRIGKGGKSKAYVASVLGVSERTVENYINGKRQPKPEVLVQLAEILGFSLEELSGQSVRTLHLPGLPAGISPREYIESLKAQIDLLTEYKEANSGDVRAMIKELQSDFRDLLRKLAPEKAGGKIETFVYPSKSKKDKPS